MWSLGLRTALARCSRCGESKPLADFYADSHRSTGVGTYCRPCLAIRRRERYASDETYREAEKARALQSYYADPQTWNARRIRWARSNRNKANAAERRLHARHPDKMRAKWTDERGRRRAGRDNPTALAYVQILRRDPCSYCGQAGGEVEHMDAIARGGTHAWDNLTSACRSCNARKGTRSLLHFLLAERDETVELGFADRIG